MNREPRYDAAWWMVLLGAASALPYPALATEPPAKTAQSEAGEPRARADRMELDTSTITGNRELPKVMYVVPWKKADIGDLVGKPVNSLLDEVLAPVDRDVFRRQVVYYNAVNAAAPKSGAAPQNEPMTPPAAPKGEK